MMLIVLLGKWRLVYTTTSGSSGGKLGPFVGSVTQDVDVATIECELYSY
jgi:hypothetical protein